MNRMNQCYYAPGIAKRTNQALFKRFKRGGGVVSKEIAKVIAW